MAALISGLCQAALAGEIAPAPDFCPAIVKALDAAAPGDGPVFIRSFQPPPDAAPLPEALRQTAFSYDNALAAIALVACGEVKRAERIGKAFLWAMAHDRAFDDGRIRNAYAAGAQGDGQGDGKAKLPGWWDAEARQWREDVFQDSTATGNVAWVALALLTLHEATGDGADLTGANRLLAWIDARASAGAGTTGYSGGQSGFDQRQSPAMWKSTEHNIDVAAAASWAHASTKDPAQAAMAERARSFVASRFDAQAGRFLIGAQPEGADRSKTPLDAQVLPALGVAGAPAEWRRAIDFALDRLRRGAGMTFAGLGSAAWTEGTAQTALALSAIGRGAQGDAMTASLPAYAAPSGLLYATSGGEAPTGLMVEGGDQPFVYFHWPHLGATAWAALAQKRWNPFTGKRIAT